MATNTTSLKFKWGQVKNNAKFTDPTNAEYKIDNGSVYVATDERSIYVDYNNKRIRLGDFLEYNTLNDLKADYASWNTSTLVYIKEGDLLTKYDPTKGWIPLNDTSALASLINNNSTEISTLKTTVQEHATNLGTLDQAIKDNANSLKNQSEAISKQEELIAANAEAIAANTEAIGDNTKGLIKNIADNAAAIQKNKDSIASQSSSISGLDSRLTNVENDIDEINNELNSINDTIGDSTKGLIKNIADNQSAISANTTAIGDNNSGLTKRVADLERNLNTDGTQITGLDTRVTALEGTIGDATSGLVKAVNDNKNDISNIQNTIGNDSTPGTLKGEIKSIKDTLGNSSTGLIKDIADNKANISTNATSISNLDAKIDKTKTDLTDYINSSMQTADAMTFRGVIKSYSELPTSGVQCGDTYKVGAKIDKVSTNVYQEDTWYVGDLIIAKADQGEGEVYTGNWYHISSGYEDDYNAYLTGNANTNTVQLNGGAGEEKGSIAISSANDCLVVGLATEAVDSSSAQDCKFSVDIIWGEF